MLQEALKIMMDFYGVMNGINNKTMKKLILLLLFIPLVSFGQVKDGVEFIFSDDFELAPPELILNSTFDKATLNLMSKEEKNSFLSKVEYYRKINRNNLAENISIENSPLSGTPKSLYDLMYDAYKKASLGNHRAYNIIDIGIKKFNGIYTVVYMDVYNSLDESNSLGYWTMACYIYVGDKIYLISINTLDRIKLEDVLKKINTR